MFALCVTLSAEKISVRRRVSAVGKDTNGLEYGIEFLHVGGASAQCSTTTSFGEALTKGFARSR